MQAGNRFYLGFIVALQLRRLLPWLDEHFDPPTPFKNLRHASPRGVPLPFLGDGPHASFFVISLHVRLAAFHSQALLTPPVCRCHP